MFYVTKCRYGTDKNLEGINNKITTSIPAFARRTTINYIKFEHNHSVIGISNRYIQKANSTLYCTATPFGDCCVLAELLKNQDKEQFGRMAKT
jgi:hypothetical protein